MGRVVIAWLGLALVAALLLALPAPRTDRAWETALSRAPTFSRIGGERWRLHDLRAYEFARGGAPIWQDWRDTTINSGDLEEVWFFVEPFEGFSGAAHTLISFVFGGDIGQTISISVEARREQGETYSGVSGMFSAYELIYLWSTEKDVLSRIAVGLDHEIYAYRLQVSPQQAQQILDHFIMRTNALAERPRFYNTLTSNCTNELAKAVNSAFPGALPWHPSHILTGHAAQRLHALGFIGGGKVDFEDIKAAAQAQAAVKLAAKAPDREFSQIWRAALAKNDP